MPYGQEAGHYGDITALVNTGHPSRIPLAYKYREGDYSTQVEIEILSSREWELGYYPPPDERPNQQNNHLPTYHGQNPHSNRRTPTQNTSSSSSNSGPSEPTIDLSCWSPRSHCPLLDWTRKVTSFRKLSATERHLTMSLHLKEFNLTSPSNGLSTGHLTHDRKHDGATLNQTVSEILSRAHSLMRFIVFTPTHSPIAENPLRLLTPPLSDRKTSGQLPTRLATSAISSYCTNRPTQKKDLPNLNLNLNISDGETYLLLLSLTSPNGQQTFAGPAKPNTIHSFSTWIHQNLFLTKPPPARPDTYFRLHLNLSLHLPISFHSAHTSQPHLQDYPLMIQSTHPLLSLQNQLSFFGDNSGHLRGSHSPGRMLQPGTQNLSYTATRFDQITQSQRTQSHSPIIEEVQIQTNLTYALPEGLHMEKPKKKGKQMATRRSPRLQAKQRTPNSMLQHPNKAKSLTARIPFDLDMTDAPIDATKTLAILQASGLEISDRIQRMVNEAARQAARDDTHDESAPTTPLHDNIPPLAVPGADLLL